MSPQANAFLALIEKGSELLATLCRLCDDEKQAVERQAVEELQQVVSAKQQILQALAENTEARNQLLQAAGSSADRAGVDHYLNTLPAADRTAVESAWQQLVKSLQQASELNQRNEQIVSRNQKNLEQLLAILRGQSAKTTLYDQAGLRNYSARSTLGKA